MIRMTLHANNDYIGMIGISDANLLRMKAGRPLDINLKELTPPGTQMNRLVVHYAPTYEQAVDDMADGGIPISNEIRQMAKDLDAEMGS